MKSNRATIVVGLGFGDCGKGSIVDYLARSGDVHTVVRFNGGPQAGHNVMTADGRHHTFSQFGSGTLAGPGIATLLSRFMLIEPYALLNEAEHLQSLGCDDIWERLFIDARCAVITPAQQAANRLREHARDAAAHGSCGMGVGETVADSIDQPNLALLAGDLRDTDLVRSKILRIVEYKADQLRPIVAQLREDPLAARDVDVIYDPQWIEVAVDACCAVAGAARIIKADDVQEILARPGETLFEGAQGALLDQDHGFHPHTTWSSTTTANALRLLTEAGMNREVRRIGVLRTYSTRHGAGPLVSEVTSMREALPEPHNADASYQGVFRTGVFDAVAARYAISVSGVDEIAMTHLDRIKELPNYFCAGYELPGEGPLRLIGRHRSGPPCSEAITRSLLRCRPVMRGLSNMDEQTFLTVMQNELGLPIRLISRGAAANDKQLTHIPIDTSH